MINLLRGNKILIVGLIVVFLVFLIPLWGVLSFFIVTVTAPSPPRPAITRGEFDFRLEYELDGERIVIEDTIIAQFAGINHFSVNGKHRRWRLHLASNRRAQQLLLLELEDGRRLYYHFGGAGFYMGEVSTLLPGVTREDLPGLGTRNSIFYVERGRDTSIGNRQGLTFEELYNDFGIRLISWEHDPPIENSFE